ncbi:hypothetical protein AB1N83_005591 [Pleurotus pulmonarius]
MCMGHALPRPRKQACSYGRCHVLPVLLKSRKDRQTSTIYPICARSLRNLSYFHIESLRNKHRFVQADAPRWTTNRLVQRTYFSFVLALNRREQHDG